MSRANLNKDPDEVAAMFDGVAKRYDLVNDLLSLGRTKAWRKAATKIIAPAPGMVILDLAAGPGSSSEPLFKAGATVFATDFSEGMLAQGEKLARISTFPRPMPSICPLRRTDLMLSPSLTACETQQISTRRWPRPAESLSQGAEWWSSNSATQPGVRFAPFIPNT
jgi:hypothetical protein